LGLLFPEGSELELPEDGMIAENPFLDHDIDGLVGEL